jgi:hypothetical protein
MCSIQYIQKEKVNISTAGVKTIIISTEEIEYKIYNQMR